MISLSGSVTLATASGSTLSSAGLRLRPRLPLPVACSSAAQAAIFSCWRAAVAAALAASFSRQAGEPRLAAGAVGKLRRQFVAALVAQERILGGIHRRG